MNGPDRLCDAEQAWVTEMGAWFPGERVVFRGRDLFDELAGMRWMGLLLFGITGRIFDDRQLRLFEGIWTISTSYPDPRLWNNRVAALAGTARSSAALGISAANAVSEATIYGGRPFIRVSDFLLRADDARRAGEALEAFVHRELGERRRIFGYGRPLVNGDERIEPLMNLARQLGVADGAYVRLAFAVERILARAPRRLRMNVAALLSALLVDQGLSPRECSRFMVLCFSAGMFPCYEDALNQPEGAFFPLRCRRIRYEGHPRRRWEPQWTGAR